MSGRELVVLGTASQAPTRNRNHNGYVLRWDGVGAARRIVDDVVVARDLDVIPVPSRRQALT